jgi:hypothetical protein
MRMVVGSFCLPMPTATAAAGNMHDDEDSFILDSLLFSLTLASLVIPIGIPRFIF